jgi:hypothetical protein
MDVIKELENLFGGGSLQPPPTEDQLKAQREMEAHALRQFDPERALLLANLQALMGLHPYLTPQERDQINALAQSVVGRLGMQQALPGNTEV